MMMPHTTGTMNGRTIWKHHATSESHQADADGGFDRSANENPIREGAW